MHTLMIYNEMTVWIRLTIVLATLHVTTEWDK